jgi:hypothetical protein
MDLKPGDIEKTAALLVSSARFQEVARTDYAKALLAYTKNKGIEKLHTIDSTLWEPEQSQIAWMLFFNSAIRVPAGLGSVSPLIGYYNPYSDVFLITAWAPEDDLYKIVDAELLMGDWVRKEDSELDIVPLWLRETTYPPEAIGLGVARSVQAFEDAFAQASSSDWRHELPILEEPDALQDLNYPLAALMMVNQQINVIDFSNPEPEDQQTMRLRDLTVSTIDMAGNGAIEYLLTSAKDTSEAVGHLLRNFPPDWFSTLKVASVVNASDGSLVMLSSTGKNASLALFFKEEDTILKMNRIDLVDYQNYYTYQKTQND